MKISRNFVAFSECMNSTTTTYFRIEFNPLWSHARAPLRKDGKSVCTAICKWFIFKSVWPKVEQNRPIKQSKIKYDLVFMDWMDWCSYNRSRYEVSRIDAKPAINLTVLQCSVSGNFRSTNFSSNLNENWKISFSFYANL